MSYSVIYSPEALNDLRSIYRYIAQELLSPTYAENQVNRIRKAIRSLDTFPKGHTLVDWEPWASIEMRFIPIDNYIAYYLVKDDIQHVEIVRIFYSGRDIEHIIRDGYPSA